MYNSQLTDKDCKYAKQFRQLSGIGMIEAVSITKGLGCYSLTDLVNWMIDSMATSVDLLSFRISILLPICSTDALFPGKEPANLFHCSLQSWKPKVGKSDPGFDIEQKLKDSQFIIG